MRAFIHCVKAYGLYCELYEYDDKVHPTLREFTVLYDGLEEYINKANNSIIVMKEFSSYECEMLNYMWHGLTPTIAKELSLIGL